MYRRWWRGRIPGKRRVAHHLQFIQKGGVCAGLRKFKEYHSRLLPKAFPFEVLLVGQRVEQYPAIPCRRGSEYPIDRNNTVCRCRKHTELCLLREKRGSGTIRQQHTSCDGKAQAEFFLSCVGLGKRIGLPSQQPTTRLAFARFKLMFQPLFEVQVGKSIECAIRSWCALPHFLLCALLSTGYTAIPDTRWRENRQLPTD